MNKKSILIFLIFFICLSVFSEDNNDLIRIGVINVENLWDNDPYNNKAYDQFDIKKSNWYEKGIIDRKIENVLMQIKLMKADIIGLVEIEWNASDPEKVFKIPVVINEQKTTFQEELEKDGFKEFIIGKQDSKESSIAVTTAIISKFKVINNEIIDIISDIFKDSARDIQVIEIKCDKNSVSDNITIILSHWKSRNDKTYDDEKMRNKTADEIRKYVNTLPTDKKIIVMGDLNSYYYEEEQRLHLKTTGNEVDVYNGNTVYFYNLWYELKSENRWSDQYDNKLNALMNILINSSLYNGNGINYKDNSFEVIGQNKNTDAGKILLMKNKDGYYFPYRWEIIKKNNLFTHLGKGYSDHLPIVAEFYFTKEKIKNFNASSNKTEISQPHEIIPIKDME